MHRYKLKTTTRKLLADMLTPVNIYLKVRDVFAGSILLESSDYHGHEDSLSLICCDPVASFEVNHDQVQASYPDGIVHQHKTSSRDDVMQQLIQFYSAFEVQNIEYQHAVPGLFGYIAYDAVRFFEDIDLKISDQKIPDILYKLFRYVIVVDHFTNTLYLTAIDIDDTSFGSSGLDKMEQILFSHRLSSYRFTIDGSEESNYSDEEFLSIIKKGKEHCFRGDVFQIVLSRQFKTTFQGDEFNVYRALRSINPSPYLFFFDFGDFKLFGSSPEAQLQIKNGKANIFPIAGTFRRTGNDIEDAALANQLKIDEKENAEHLMLVDLARNDMSRNAQSVTVEVFKEIQFYSHVIHLVSKVSGTIDKTSSIFRIIADTFPAGTLSGAPKHNAMKLIDRYENINRSFYGGAIGFISFDGSFNHAIMIRTFLSNANELTYQAGAGIVSGSDEHKELQEVNNKLGALRQAVKMAETI